MLAGHKANTQFTSSQSRTRHSTANERFEQLAKRVDLAWASNKSPTLFIVGENSAKTNEFALFDGEAAEMTMATAQVLVRPRPAVSYCICLLFFILTVAMVNEPALVKAHHPSLPSSLKLYFIVTDSLVVASPSGSHNASEYGSIIIFNDFARESEDEDSTVLGQSFVQAVLAKDGSRLVSFAYALNASGYAGSITGQGSGDSLGNGKVAITGGTDDFLSAKGYIENRVTPKGNTVVVKSTVYFQYD